jgi:hypothetical protein
MGRLWTAGPGILIIAFTLREIFQDLFLPGGSGSLSDFVARNVYRLFRRRRSLLPAAGPLAVVLVILCWVLLIGVGFALIYWDSFPNEVHVASGKSVAEERGLWPALYLSFEVLTTLGLGDVAPKPTWLRMLVSLEALIGFSILTASVSSIVLLYPALARMRTLARRTWTLAEAERRTEVAVVSGNAEILLGALALEVIETRVDLIHFPLLYYFHSDNRAASLREAIPHLVRFAEQGSRRNDADRVRLAAAALRVALDDLADLLGRRFVDADPGDPEAVFRAFAEDHANPAA